MAEGEKQWVVSRTMVKWAWLVFLVGVAYFIWFFVVVYGETQGWSDNPGAWAGLPTDAWAIFGYIIYTILVVYLLALLVHHETPAQVFLIDDEGQVVQGAGAQTRSTQVVQAEADDDEVPWPE